MICVLEYGQSSFEGTSCADSVYPVRFVGLHFEMWDIEMLTCVASGAEASSFVNVLDFPLLVADAGYTRELACQQMSFLTNPQYCVAKV